MTCLHAFTTVREIGDELKLWIIREVRDLTLVQTSNGRYPISPLS
jgi:hypothetical protein